MVSLSSWALSIAGICLISVLVDFALPECKMNEHIKKVVSYSIILVVVYPLPNLFNNNFSFDNILQEVDIPIQSEYIYNVNQAKVDELTKTINASLENKGLYGATVSISADIFQTELEIFAVYVDLYNLVIKSEIKNTDIKTEVVSVVLNIVDISKDKVVVYE